MSMDDKNKIDDFIISFGDWRSHRLQELRELINRVGPQLKEEYKWNVPVWSDKRLICAISGHKEFVKINFFKGAYLPDQSLFNSGLDSKEHRSINIRETDKLDEAKLKQLIKAAIEHDEQ